MISKFQSARACFFAFLKCLIAQTITAKYKKILQKTKICVESCALQECDNTLKRFKGTVSFSHGLLPQFEDILIFTSFNYEISSNCLLVLGHVLPSSIYQQSLAQQQYQSQLQWGLQKFPYKLMHAWSNSYTAMYVTLYRLKLRAHLLFSCFT